jgi:hypothetical protein
LEEKRPRARHRFGFSGKPERNKQTATTTDQILNSMNRQVQPGGNIGEPEENSLQESVQMTESEESAEYSRGRNISRWLFLGILASIVVVLWVFDLFPSILYVDTIGSLGSLLPMIPRIDLEIIVIIWMAALFFGLVARGVRHASRAHRG